MNMNADPSPASLDRLFAALARSKFRGRFMLKEKDLSYLAEKGLDNVMQHARRFLSMRLFPAQIANDGKQTPLHGHPVFVAQHATATCCRKCLSKWHGIPPGRPLAKAEQDHLLGVIRTWLEKQAEAAGPVHTRPWMRQSATQGATGGGGLLDASPASQEFLQGRERQFAAFHG
jgi:hypothetical protein